MANRTCWKCGQASHMTLVKAYPITTLDPQQGDLLAGFYSCDNCAWPNAAIGGEYRGTNVPHYHGLAAAEFRWIPEAATGKDFPDVPEHIASAADEAYRCRSFDALRASVLMARSVIEATAKEKEIIGGQLYSKIDAMEKQGFIRAHIKQAAHEIRLLGNNMAHGDFIEAVEPEEADEILELMSEVLAEVFQSPAKIEKRRIAREAKKAGADSEA